MVSSSRQLAAIVFMDIAGYTELMQHNEEEALARLNRFKKLAENRSQENEGKIIQYYGDGCLLIFKSPLEAIAFAKIIQEDFSKDLPVPVRIGIHLGDLVFRDGNVFGDSVNIASRIESMGVPGAVLLSEAVNNQVRNHREYKTVSLGKFEFKNVEMPVEIFALANEGFMIPGKKQMQGKLKKKSARRRRIIIAAYITGFITIAICLYQIQLYRKDASQKDLSKIDKSIAVLPFTDMSPGKDQGYLGDGLAEEIINSLNHLPGLQIAGRTSSFTYRNKNLNIVQIGKELDVGVILEGSVQKYGNKIRVTAQLINAKNGYHLWSEHYDREMKDIFIIQDEIARNITERMSLIFTEPLTAGTNKSKKVSPQAYEMYLKGMHFLNGDQTEFYKAIPLFENAISIDSSYALAYAMLGYSYARMGWWDVMTPRDAFEKMYAMSKKSIEIDPGLAIGYAVLASSQLHANYDWKGAKENFEKSMMLDSLNPVALNEYAYYYLYSGDNNKALWLAEKNLALDPKNDFYLADIANMYMHAGMYDAARSTYVKIRNIYPGKVDGYFEEFRLLSEINKFDSANYYYQQAEQRGLKEKTKFTLYGVKRFMLEGKQQEALDLFNKNKNEVKAMDKAFIYALFNKFDEMMENLEISYLERDDDLLAINSLKEFNGFRREKRFIELIERLNFPVKD